MESTSDANSLLDPNFALHIYSKCGKIDDIVTKIKLIIEEFRINSERVHSKLFPTLKNHSKSKELREEAENHFLRNKDQSTLLRVLELYNESLCYAERGENGDEHLASLYAGRARVYFDLKEYRTCLENIDLAEDNGYAGNESIQLSKLKADSLELVIKLSNNRNETQDDVRVYQNVQPQQQIPFAANSLEIKYDTTQGRYIATNEDIDPGTIIITESPFVKVLSSDYIYQRCSNCTTRNSLYLIPCPNCTKAMFCTETCMQEASKSFHQFECPIIDCLIDVGGQITMRTFLKAIESFNSIAELIEFLRTTDTNLKTAFPFNHSEELSPQQDYHRIHCLSTNQHVRPALDLFTHVLVAALFYYQLTSHCPPFIDLIANECAEENSLMELMFRIELITTINSFNFDDLQQEGNVIGTGLYQWSSLINHSCVPNAWPKFRKNDLILYTTQPIQRGEAISISYTGTHAFLSKEKRQSFLVGKYHFWCHCIACANDFPLLYNMTLANIPEIHSNGRNIQLDRVIGGNIYRKCCAYLREHYRHYPCREIFSMQICLSKLLSFLLMNDDNCSMELCIGKLGEVNHEDIVLE